VSENFKGRHDAETYARTHDEDARRLGRLTADRLRQEEREACAARGILVLLDGPKGKDELSASVLAVRYPFIAEARAVLAEPEPEPGSETVTFTFPGGHQVTVPPMAEDPRVTAPAPMSAEDMLRLVEDGSNDYVEGIGGRGGYVSYSVEGDVLTVKVQAFTGDGEDLDEKDLDKLETTERKWRLVPAEDETALDALR
jgi:hypothetical protein